MNLLFLYTDEQRADTLAAYGNTKIQMPNLNRLASQSTVFRKAYVTQPVCTPSRSSLLTGLYPHTNGCTTNNIPLREDTLCLPEMLATGKYRCAHHGKWHLGDEIYPQHGFTEWEGTEDTYHRFYSKKHDEYADRSAYHHWLVSRGVKPEDKIAALPPGKRAPYLVNRFFREQIHRLPEEHSRPAFLGETASRFLRENRDRPFVLYVNFLEPHMPFHSCRDNQYRPEDVTLPANVGHLPDERTPLAGGKTAQYRAKGFEGQGLRNERGWRELTARYWGMCSLVDTHVGRILDTLAELGLDRNTVVVFTSDHGDMMGSHGLVGKGVMYEESVTMPLLVRLPGQTAQRVVNAPVSQIDLVPTLLDLMGEKALAVLQGRSLRPVLEGREKDPGRDVFIEWIPVSGAKEEKENVRTVVTAEGWKFNWSSGGYHELYDLGSDPLELRNRAEEKGQARRIRDLKERIRGWQKEERIADFGLRIAD